MKTWNLSLRDRKQNALEALRGGYAGLGTPETGEVSGSLIPASAKVPEDFGH